MRASMPILLILCVVAATPAWAGEAPYLGTWKQNATKSDFGEVTLTFEDLADGQMKMTADGQSVLFKADGKDYPTPWGDAIAWKAVDAKTWQTTSKVNGKVSSTGTLTLSADGKTLKSESKVNRANGETSASSSVYQRTSGATGLAGKWKAQKVNTALSHVSGQPQRFGRRQGADERQRCAGRERESEGRLRPAVSNFLR